VLNGSTMEKVRVRQCRVLPPGEFNGIVAEPLPVYSESFKTIAATVFPYYCSGNKRLNSAASQQSSRAL